MGRQRHRPPGPIERGIRAQQAGDLARARLCYEAALAANPRDVDALQLMGALAYESGDHRGCVAWIDKALAIARHPVFLVNQGMAFEALGDVDAAAERFREATERQPDEPDHHRRLGELLLRTGRHAAAITTYEAALRQFPEFRPALAGLANALRLVGRCAEAREVAERRLALDPDVAEAHVDLGAVLYDAGDPPAARRCLERALELDAASRVAHHNLACVLDALGERDAALAEFRRASEVAGDDPEAFSDLGLALLGNGLPDEAARCLARALELDPGNAVARHFLAAARDERPERASADYVRGLFDHYAPGFDQHLQRNLDYRTPELLAERLPPGGPSDILDLGAGTGLMGVLLRPRARSLTGVDLSSRMLAVAESRGVYDRVVVADLLDHLRATPAASLDLVVAADVFVYLGELGPVFAQVARVLRSDGQFAFSLECADDDRHPYELGHSGRYRHSRAYLDRLCAAHGFFADRVDPAVLRTERARPVAGWVVVLGRHRG